MKEINTRYLLEVLNSRVKIRRTLYPATRFYTVSSKIGLVVKNASQKNIKKAFYVVRSGIYLPTVVCQFQLNLLVNYSVICTHAFKNVLTNFENLTNSGKYSPYHATKKNDITKN